MVLRLFLSLSVINNLVYSQKSKQAPITCPQCPSQTTEWHSLPPQSELIEEEDLVHFVLLCPLHFSDKNSWLLACHPTPRCSLKSLCDWLPNSDFIECSYRKHLVFLRMLLTLAWLGSSPSSCIFCFLINTAFIRVLSGCDLITFSLCIFFG